MSLKSTVKPVIVSVMFCGALLFGSFAGAAESVAPASADAVKTTIFDYQKEIGLKDQQVDDIRQKIIDLQRSIKKINANLTLLNLDIEDINRNNGDFDTLKKKVKDAYALVADLKIIDFKTTRDINAIMEAKQLKKWRKIQKKNKK